MNLKAAYLQRTGETEAAINLFFDIAEKLEERNERDKLIMNYYNVSSLLKNHYSMEKELEYLLKAHQLVQETGERQLAIVIIASIGESYYFQENYKEAEN